MVSETPIPKDSQNLKTTEVVFVDGGFSLTKVTHAPESGWGKYGLVSFHLKEVGGTYDALQVDSYDEGYFAATWKTPASMEDFLSAAEGYFSEFEEVTDPEKLHNAILIPEGGTKEGVFEAEYTRPMTLDVLKDTQLPTGGDVSKIGLLRLNDPMGDVIYDAWGSLNGVIAPSETESIQSVKTAVSNLVHRTQPNIPAEMVVRTLGFLPHIRPVQIQQS